MVFVQKCPFYHTFFFQAIQPRKMSFTISYNEKTPFQAIKTKNSKSRIIDIFPSGLTNGFGPKMAIFPNFFFRQNRPGKCFLRYFTTKKTLFYAIKATSSKSQKSRHFYKGVNSCFCPKMTIVSKCFFKAIQARKMSFTIFQNERTPFQALKTTS